MPAAETLIRRDRKSGLVLMAWTSEVGYSPSEFSHNIPCRLTDGERQDVSQQAWLRSANGRLHGRTRVVRLLARTAARHIAQTAEPRRAIRSTRCARTWFRMFSILRSERVLLQPFSRLHPIDRGEDVIA